MNKTMTISRFFREKRGKFDLFYFLLVFFSVFSLAYYLIVGVFAGFGMSFLPVWLAISLFLYLWSRFYVVRIRGLFRLPSWIRIIFYILVSLFIGLFIVVEGFIVSGFFKTAPDNAEYAIVLGAKVNGNVPSLSLIKRINCAYSYLSENPDTICIASGGKGDDELISEAQCIKEQLIARGIDSSRIITEAQSESTSENLKFSSALIENKNASVTIITNNFHSFRGQALARKCGLTNVSGYPARMVFPLLLHYMVREFATVVVDTLRGNLVY